MPGTFDPDITFGSAGDVGAEADAYNATQPTPAILTGANDQTTPAGQAMSASYLDMLGLGGSQGQMGQQGQMPKFGGGPSYQTSSAPPGAKNPLTPAVGPAQMAQSAMESY